MRESRTEWQVIYRDAEGWISVVYEFVKNCARDPQAAALRPADWKNRMEF